MLIPLWLIVQMGWMAVLFTGGLVAGCIAWYYAYADHRVVRDGAIYHVFERMGRRVYRGLDDELRGIVADKGLDDEDPVEHFVLDAAVIDLDEESTCAEAIEAVSAELDKDADWHVEPVHEALRARVRGALPVIAGFGLVHLSMEGVPASRLVLVRALEGIVLAVPSRGVPRINALAVLVGPEEEFALHLRLMAHFSRRVDDVDFEGAWAEARTPTELKEVLLREDRYHTVRLVPDRPGGTLIGRALVDAQLPRGLIIALVHRVDGVVFVPNGDDVFREGDRITAIGDPDLIRAFREAFDPVHPDADVRAAPVAG